jgi:uncharacterized protein (DUF305 family)
MRRALTVIPVVLSLAAGCGTAAPHPAGPAASAAPAASATAAVAADHDAGDVAFVQGLITHHRQGIALAAATAAAHPQARTMAEAIIVTQQDEVVRMTTWLKAWGAGAPPSTSPAPSTGDPLRALIAHQEQAVTLAQQEQAKGANPAALAFAKQVIESRTGQVTQLRGYLR